jgi:hypothetical protein
MNSVEFYTKYDDLASKYATLEAKTKDIKPVEAKIERNELDYELTRLMADDMGTVINILA